MVPNHSSSLLERAYLLQILPGFQDADALKGQYISAKGNTLAGMGWQRFARGVTPSLVMYSPVGAWCNDVLAAMLSCSATDKHALHLPSYPASGPLPGSP